MKTHHRILPRVLVLAAAALFAVVRGAQAQTPEGTVIRNIARATFTDANGNPYAAVADTVDVTVGFAPGIDVTSSASVTPASPSTADVLSFPIQNIGNGTDSVSIGTSVSVAGVISITGYRYNSVTYANLAALNAALSAVPVAQGASITVDVLYDVLSGQGGVSTSVTLTATSRRSNTTSDAAASAITPVENKGVAVTPDGAQNIQRLPTNAAAPYTFTFAVNNTGNGPEAFDLLASNPGAAIAIVSVNGVAGASTTIGPLAAGASQNIVVEYTVASVAAGTRDTVVLRATAATDNTVFDRGFADVEVVRPSLAIAKEAWLGNRSAQISGPVLPGDFIEYKVTVTNSGASAATTVVVTDNLPPQVTFVTAENTASAWTSINQAAGVVTATLNGNLAPSASAVFWIRVQVN